MPSFQLPRNPDDFRKPSITDEQGKNRFAEADGELDSSAPLSDNLFTSPQADDQPAYQPDGYLPALRHRDSLIFSLSIIALLGTAASVWALMYNQPFAIVNLALTLPPLIMGHLDLKAIKAGAMDPSGRQITKIGFSIALLCTAATAILITIWLVQLIIEISE